MFGIGMPELLIILLVVLLLFGEKRIIGIAKGLGSSIKEFKGALSHANKPKDLEK